MKKIVFACISLVLVFSACKKDQSPTVPVNDPLDTTAQVKFTGTFINGPFGMVTGTAQVLRAGNNDSYSLALKDVMISNGPDLHVYLSKEGQPVNFIDLGKLKSAAGTQVYSIIGNPDFTQYKYALVHCQRFNHLFESAELMMR
ncbi:MAG: DM13 domain-containing protein [Chitinophagaceae bacterium]|nr:DM13 domain-containing protein [Chitinophagaceae bacterium]